MQLSEEQRMVQDMARSFAEGQIKPNAASWEKSGEIPSDFLREMGALGLMGMTVPEEWDGAETDYVSYALALIEIAAGDGGLSTLMSVNNAPVCAAILQSGTNAQKERFLKPLAKGEMIGAFCLTEPQAGSDASMLATKAERTNSGWKLNGTKQFITSGKVGGVAIVFAVTDPSAGKRGISAFLVPTDTPGYNVASVEHKLGQKSSDTCQITFDDMEISTDLLLGEEGAGYKIALANLETGRIGIAAQSVGMAKSAYEYALDYAKERKTFGTEIINHQAVGFRLADMATKLHAAELMVRQKKMLDSLA
jgi:alkylation response protein AidB-like acyl-CoA dehydrogenase